MAQLVARLKVSRCVVGLSPRGAEHFGFPPVLRDWVIKGLGMSSIPCHLSKREGDCLPMVGFLLVSFIK